MNSSARLPHAGLLIAFLIIISGALFVRLYAINDYYITTDESWHLVVANQKNIWELIQYNFRYEVHPPLSCIVWHFMLKISNNYLWLRSASVVAAVLTIPSLYILGSLYISRAAGIAMAFVFAFSALPIGLGTAIRSYSMLMLALTLVAIFAHKYKSNHSKANLFYYLLCSLIAVELHHAAAFLVLTFGFLLIIDSIKNKNKKDFLIISCSHVFLAVMVVGHAYILIKYYNFQGNDDYFGPRVGFLDQISYYLGGFTKFFTNFIVGSSDDLGDIRSISFITLFVSIIGLIKSRKWLLLYIIIAPALAISIADHFGLYPFSRVLRNNAFLFLSVLLVVGYIAEVLVDLYQPFYQKFLSKKLSSDKIKIGLLLLILLATTLVAIRSLKAKNFLRDSDPACQEFTIKRKNYELMLQEIAKRNNKNNIFITVNSVMWNFELHRNQDARIKLITKNLAIFEDRNFSFYFTSFPETEKGVLHEASDYKLFFQDLLAYLKSTDQLTKINSISFFESGNDLISRVFISYVMTDAKKNKQVLSMFHLNDGKLDCGREVLVFSVDSKFIVTKFLK